ncbi:hypothetical protein Y032_0051g2120 [Ancylostoma ceylanicum]|uniref:Uncharacterized protein n=1 Tax=Ancylostoma ceylanicum TaxID=53326 RepID=A0A016U9J0_9BILA|nr:hypothetical protein Y032_0051g2120 [Ancylostoma ceylanicum]
MIKWFSDATNLLHYDKEAEFHGCGRSRKSITLPSADELLGATGNSTNFAAFREENKHKRKGIRMFTQETYLMERKKIYG